MLTLVPLPDTQPTSYLPGGKTRINGEIPHISQVQTVRAMRGDTRWRLSPKAAADWSALQEDWVSHGGEPVRLSDAHRDQPVVQLALRRGYELWSAAGQPEPGSVRWRQGMKTAFAAEPGKSWHGCGMAVDEDVHALYHQHTGRGTDQTLSTFWEIARAHGWTPVIRHPQVSQSEAWHFDHIGEMAHVYDAFRDASRTNRKYAPAYSHAAMVGCALVGQLPNQKPAHAIQAILQIGGFWCGQIDGQIGKMTKDALIAAGLGKLANEQDHHVIVSALTESGIGAEEMARL